jgi:hypothetical protein
MTELAQLRTHLERYDAFHHRGVPTCRDRLSSREMIVLIGRAVLELSTVLEPWIQIAQRPPYTPSRCKPVPLPSGPSAMDE